MVYYDPRKPKPWPIRVLNNWGVRNDSTATTIVIVISIVFILLAIFLYINTNNQEQIDRSIDTAQLRQLGL